MRCLSLFVSAARMRLSSVDVSLGLGRLLIALHRGFGLRGFRMARSCVVHVDFLQGFRSTGCSGLTALSGDII